MSLTNRIKELIVKEEGLNITSLEKKLGLSRYSISRWDENFPSYDKVLKVAEYFNVSLEWLLTGNNPNIHEASIEDLKILKMISNLSVQDKLKIEGFLEFKLYEQNLENKKEEPKITYKNVVDFQDIKIDEPETDYSVSKKIPVLGKTAAGDFIYMTEPNSYSKKITANSSFADFALEVDGESMEPLIKNGSYIEIQQTNYVDNGTIAIVKYNDQVTCKKFFNDGNGKIRLESLNPSYNDIFLQLNEFDDEYNSFQIIGEVLI